MHTRRAPGQRSATGIGKTRLALEVGAELVDIYPDGVWQVELAALAHADLVAETVAATLGLDHVSGESVLANLVAQLESKHLLLILDTSVA